MGRSFKLLTFLTVFLVIFAFLFSPQPVYAASLGNIFTSPDSFFVKIQERIEYFFAFNTEQKITVLEKQAERRLAQAENLIKTKDVNKVSSLIKSYETLKETQGDLIKSASITVPAEVKEQTV